MLLGFKYRFAAFVQDGSKQHTIRATRKVPPKVGETCHCYVNPRQKTMRLLGRWPCVRVEPIQIYECADGRFSVIVGGIELTPDEKAELAWRDGFRSYRQAEAFTEMIRFWMETHGDQRIIDVSRINFPKYGEPFAPNRGRSLDFEGQIIHWKWSQSRA